MAHELVVKNGLIVSGAARITGGVTLSGLTGGFLVTNGSGVVSVDTSTYLTTASAASTYLTQANAASTYQPLDGDLTAIAALSGTTGFIKKTAANTYTLDTATYQNVSEKGQNNGYASLDSGGKVPSSQLPAYVDDVLEYANLAAFPGTGTAGIIYVALDTNLTYRWGGSSYTAIASGAVTSVNTFTGAVVLTTTDIGEGTNLYYTTARFDTRFATKTTADLTEHSSNLYYTDTRVRAAVLTGFATGTNSAVVATDTILAAFGKVQTQLNNKQALDADLTAIAALAGTSGFLKKTAADTWTLDTSTYITSLTDTLDSVTSRGATTTNAITVGDITVGTGAGKIGSKSVALAVGTNVLLSVNKTTYKGMFVDYVLSNGTNQRSGTLQITSDGTTVNETETVTNDIGNTGSIDVDAVIGSTLDLRATGLPDTSYTIKIIYRYI